MCFVLWLDLNVSTNIFDDLLSTNITVGSFCSSPNSFNISRKYKIVLVHKSIALISASVEECETVLSFLLTEYIALDKNNFQVVIGHLYQ